MKVDFTIHFFCPVVSFPWLHPDIYPFAHRSLLDNGAIPSYTISNLSLFGSVFA